MIFSFVKKAKARIDRLPPLKCISVEEKKKILLFHSHAILILLRRHGITDIGDSLYQSLSLGVDDNPRFL